MSESPLSQPSVPAKGRSSRALYRRFREELRQPEETWDAPDGAPKAATPAPAKKPEGSASRR